MEKYVSEFTNEYGEKWIYEYDFSIGKGIIKGSDVDWEEYPVINGRVFKLLLNESELRWLQGCWDEVLQMLRENKELAKRILSKKYKSLVGTEQIKYLVKGFDRVNYEIKEDIKTLITNPDETNELWLWNQLPPPGKAELDINLAFKLLTTLITLAYKFHNEKKFVLGNRAEEIVMSMVIDMAVEIASNERVAVDDYEDFRETYYEDLDFLFLYDLSYDGIDKSPIGKGLGIGSLEVKDWFEPFNAPRKPHPFFWPEKERLRFPGNKKVLVEKEESSEELQNEDSCDRSEDIDPPF